MSSHCYTQCIYVCMYIYNHVRGSYQCSSLAYSIEVYYVLIIYCYIIAQCSCCSCDDNLRANSTIHVCTVERNTSLCSAFKEVLHILKTVRIMQYYSVADTEGLQWLQLKPPLKIVRAFQNLFTIRVGNKITKSYTYDSVLHWDFLLA